MTTWMDAVCDEHKEYCPVVLWMGSHVMSLWCLDAKVAGEWVDKHYKCKLRLVSEYSPDAEVHHEKNYTTPYVLGGRVKDNS